MNITYSCPQCGTQNRTEFADQPAVLRCSACQTGLETIPGAWADRVLHRCVVCPSQELFVRKDFSQRAGVTIVIVGFVLASVAWAWYLPLWTYGILFATALIDVVLFLITANLLQCYYCKAEYRDVPQSSGHGSFDLEVHERFRQQAARMAEQQSATSSVDAHRPAT